MIDCKIKNGNVWLENPDKDAVQLVYNCLSVPVPGREHIPLYQRGHWDGVKHFFSHQYKYFKIGLLPYVERTLSIKFNILQDDRLTGDLKYLPFKLWVEQEHGWVEPRDFQIETVMEMLKNRGGLAALATNAGKTGCIVGLIKALVAAGKSVAITEMTKDLLEQVKTEINKCLDMHIGVITADVKNIRPVTILMVPTTTQAIRRANLGKEKFMDGEIVGFISSVDAIIGDEIHHATNASYKAIFSLNLAAMRFGFSGTIQSDTMVEEGKVVPNIAGLEIRELMGEVVCTVKNQELIDRGISARPFIHMVEYTDDAAVAAKAYGKTIRNECYDCIELTGQIKVGDKVKVIEQDCAGDSGVVQAMAHFNATVLMEDGKTRDLPVTQLEKYKLIFNVPKYTNKMRAFVMENTVRENIEQRELIKKIIEKHKGMPTIIIVDWIDYGEKLASYLGATVYSSQVKNSGQVVEDFKSGKITKVVATSKIDEGLSISNAAVMIFATTGSGTRQFLQRIGRGLRKKAGDNTLQVYDFVRYGHPYLIEPSKKRIALWQSEGFEIDFVEDL